MEWAGWNYDPKIRRLIAPCVAILTPMTGAVLETLILASGSPVSGRSLAEAIAKNSSTRDPLNCVGMAVHRFNALIKSFDIVGIENVRRFGYRLRPAATLSLEGENAKRRIAVEAILIEQLEATGPHARAVSKIIERLYEP